MGTVKCADCGREIDTAGQAVYSEVYCPSCGQKQVKKELKQIYPKSQG